MSTAVTVNWRWLNANAILEQGQVLTEQKESAPFQKDYRNDVRYSHAECHH